MFSGTQVQQRSQAQYGECWDVDPQERAEGEETEVTGGAREVGGWVAAWREHRLRGHSGVSSSLAMGPGKVTDLSSESQFLIPKTGVQ